MPFNGKMDEIAIYNFELSSNQVSNHYSAGIGTYGGTCSSTSGFPSSPWNFISGLFDGSTASKLALEITVLKFFYLTSCMTTVI